MRKMLSALAIFAVMLPASMLAQKNQLVGSGKIVSKDYPVSSFDQLSVSGIFSVILSQGNKESVRIEAEDNLLSHFQLKNEGSKLVVGMKKDGAEIKPKKTIKLYVTIKKLKAMDLQTVGEVSTSESLNFDALKLRNSSVGNVSLKFTANSINIENNSVGEMALSGKCQTAVIRNNGVGSLDAGTLVVQEMDIENNGIGEAEVNAEKRLKVKDSMLGKVVNKGGASVIKSKKVVI